MFKIIGFDGIVNTHIQFQFQWSSISRQELSLSFVITLCSKFQGKQWKLKLQDPDFRKIVLDIMDEEIVKKFELEGKNFGVSEDE